jgi:hypothetical protein
LRYRRAQLQGFLFIDRATDGDRATDPIVRLLDQQLVPGEQPPAPARVTDVVEALGAFPPNALVTITIEYGEPTEAEPQPPTDAHERDVEPS